MTTTPVPIWTGTLTIGGRSPEPFAAEVYIVDGEPALYRRVDAMVLERVSPNEVNGTSWLAALAAMAQGGT